MSSDDIRHDSTEGAMAVDVPTVDELAAIEAEGTRNRSRGALARMIIGVLALVVGGGVTLASYLGAESAGGQYVVWYGPMLIGAFLAVTGLLAWLHERGARKKRALEELYGIRAR